MYSRLGQSEDDDDSEPEKAMEARKAMKAAKPEKPEEDDAEDADDENIDIEKAADNVAAKPLPGQRLATNVRRHVNTNTSNRLLRYQRYLRFLRFSEFVRFLNILRARDLQIIQIPAFFEMTGSASTTLDVA